ncbi:hypothetical protein BJ138DRAFT_1122783 [Hygrophoropsis aurantiaca]|uniref:Uncharacterized protein n=1 Tax=Hygrophoropsis aurantiaca TaxID=72124 RepID=A0ACB8APK0_9AGAM|nr:hypothetical protein BJ138DRAFT_1122783 [Hygrophoropsis aurantiaca]
MSNLRFYLPTELKREILETAVVDHPSCAPRITLVSRAVHGWIELLMYETIELKNRASLEGFARTISLKGTEFISKHVKMLSIQFDEREEALVVGPNPTGIIMSTCTGAETLCIWSHRHYIDILDWLRTTDLQLEPRRLCLKTWDLGIDDMFDHHASTIPLFFRGVTHLELGDPWALSCWTSDIAQLPSLTHLALLYIEPSIESAIEAHIVDLQTILASSILRVLILLSRAYFDEDGKRRNFYVEDQITDGRLVMMPLTDAPKRWADEYRTREPTMWSRAESAVRH